MDPHRPLTSPRDNAATSIRHKLVPAKVIAKEDDGCGSWISAWIRGDSRSSASRIASANSASLRVIVYLDYDYDDDYEYDDEHEYEHEEGRRMAGSEAGFYPR